MNPHSGHRDRIKNRFLQDGLDGFDDHNVLELVLFYAIPRVDVNPLAHRLMDEFGSLQGVFEAGIDELSAIDGVTPNAATLLKLVPELSRRYLCSCNKIGTVIGSSDDAADFLRPLFIGARDEHCYALFTNAGNKVVGFCEMAHGDISHFELLPRKLMESALKYGATNVYLAHNHPGGIPYPSPPDEASTRYIASALKMVGIELMENFIFVGGQALKMSEYIGRK